MVTENERERNAFFLSPFKKTLRAVFFPGFAQNREKRVRKGLNSQKRLEIS